MYEYLYGLLSTQADADLALEMVFRLVFLVCGLLSIIGESFSKSDVGHWYALSGVFIGLSAGADMFIL